MPGFVFGTVAIVQLFILGRVWVCGYYARIRKLPHHKNYYIVRHRYAVKMLVCFTVLLPLPLHGITVMLRPWALHKPPADLIHASWICYALLFVNYVMLSQVTGLRKGFERWHKWLGRSAIGFNLALMGIGTELFVAIYR